MRLRRTPVLVDALLALVLTGLSVATLVDDGGLSVGWPGLVLAVLAVAPLALRQVAPVITMVAILAALAAYALLGYGAWPSGAVGVVVGMFTVATLRPRRVAAAIYPAVVAVFLLFFLTVDGVTWPNLAQASLVCLGAWALGDGTRRWAQQAEDAAAGAARSVAEERTRIARELHDVVTHHMSVVALQTGLAEYVLDSDPATARAAIATAGAASREALQDLGRMLDALRTDEAGPAPYQPQPGLDDLDGLVERVRAAGLDVELRRSGRARPLTPGLELCAFRVVQESLTNVLKHAGPGAAARVSVRYGDRVLSVEVGDDGPGTPPDGAGLEDRVASGHGVRGMRERVELYGGVLDASPLPAGGFLVRMRLPMTEPVGPVGPVEPVGQPAPPPGRALEPS